MKEILKKLEDFFGCPMPNPLNYPNSFKYYVMVYHYHNKKNEIREGHKQEMVDVYCQNCGYESHCGSIKYREERNWKDERIGEIEVCKSCRCVECTESDPRPVGQPFRKNL